MMWNYIYSSTAPPPLVVSRRKCLSRTPLVYPPQPRPPPHPPGILLSPTPHTPVRPRFRRAPPVPPFWWMGSFEGVLLEWWTTLIPTPGGGIQMRGRGDDSYSLFWVMVPYGVPSGGASFSDARYVNGCLP
jgi:hypothetical protein